MVTPQITTPIINPNIKPKPTTHPQPHPNKQSTEPPTKAKALTIARPNNDTNVDNFKANCLQKKTNSQEPISQHVDVRKDDHGQGNYHNENFDPMFEDLVGRVEFFKNEPTGDAEDCHYYCETIH